MSCILPGAVNIREPCTIYPTSLALAYSFLSKPPIRQRVNIRHPAYTDDEPPLLTLYAWDHATGGVQYGFVHTACAIIAANRHDGYLSTSRNGEAICANTGDVLRAGDYFYHVAAEDGKPMGTPGARSGQN